MFFHRISDRRQRREDLVEDLGLHAGAELGVERLEGIGDAPEGRQDAA